MDDPVGDDAAGDGAAARLEGGANLGVSVHHFLVARLEHASEHLLDVFDKCVDDAVFANAYTLQFGGALRVSFDLYVEGDDDRFGSVGQVDVVDVDVAQTG